ncbi:MAG: aminotransferase class V-fold PLP-dependent enzyme, partial [Acholeplasmataceae bacterium]|nr:aminotransferase class V-fold PLP-dependent enzyme [Acholeplasmataceae bacterium]
ATLHTCQFLENQGYKIHYLNNDSQGFVDLNQLDGLISAQTLMVTLIWANNEIGTIQNVDAISKICSKHRVVLHLDAVQVFGQLPIDVNTLHVDLLTLSAHKFYGPKGVGCLYKRKEIQMDALIHGGSQEMGLRAGTEDLLGIIGFAKAAALANKRLFVYHAHLLALSTSLLSHIRSSFPNVILNGPELGNQRLPGHLSLSFPDVLGYQLTYALDQRNVFTSIGSACNSKMIEPSHVLKAIDPSLDKVKGTIRISFGQDNRISDIPFIVKAIQDALNQL